MASSSTPDNQSSTDVLQQFMQALMNKSGSNHVIETFAFNQVSKYDGTNVKDWLTSVRSAFQMCGKEHFIRSEINIASPDYADYQRFLGHLKFTFIPKIRDHIQHLKTVYQVWDYMARFEKDSPSTAVRKFIKILSAKYNGGELRLWFQALTACFEDAESDWVKLSEKTRCIIAISMLPRPQFDRLADRLTSRESLSMKDLMNAFIEEDEKMKAGQSKQSSFNKDAINFVSKKKVNKKPLPKRNDSTCEYCNSKGHNAKDCRKKFWDDNHKSSDSSVAKSKSSTGAASSSSSSSSSKPATASSSNSKHSIRTVMLKNVCDRSSDQWIIDSGSTSHATNNESMLVDAKPTQLQFEAADGHPIITSKIGNSTIQPNPNHQIVLKNVVCGDFKSNLISVSQLLRDGYSLFFDGQSPDKTMSIINNHNIEIIDPIAVANESSGVWTIQNQNQRHQICLNLWHQRLGHCGKNVLHRIAEQVSHVKVDSGTCDSCLENKSVSTPHKHQMVYDDMDTFEFLHVDLWESPVESFGGNKYAMIIVDHRSQFCFGIPLRAGLYLPSDDEDEDQSLPVQKLIGSLSYVANRTRPNNRFSVNWLSHYVSRPTTYLWKACKQSIRYLAHS